MSASNVLPEGWARPPLGSVAAPSKEKIDPHKCKDAAYLSLEHIESSSLRILSHGTGADVKSTKAVFHAGDVLYGKLRPYLNKVCVPKFDGICSTDILVFPERGAVDSRYLARFFSTKEVVEFANHNSSGVQLPRVGFKALADLSLPLPPLAEQKRIVAKVEELLAHVNAARERLEKVQVILKRFRQAVLAAACSGQLTEDWREARPEALPVSELMLQVKKARLCATINDGVHSKLAAVQPTDELDLEFPNSWALTSIDELTSKVTSGSRDWKRYYQDDGPGTFVMAQNVRPLKFDRSYRRAVDPPEGDRDRERSAIRCNDLLVTIVGANTGDVCRVPDALAEHYVCQSVALLRPVVADTAAFLELSLNSPSHGQAQFQHWMYGEGRPHLSFEQLTATAIPLPSLQEQNEIVGRVQRLLSLADAIEERLRSVASGVAGVTSAILQRAFRGELVPTEAELARQEGRDYEPASVLLERITAERESVKIASHRKKRVSKRVARSR